MKTYTYLDAPMRIFGVPFFEKTKQLRRLTDDVCAAVPSLERFGLRTPGARLCFRTNAVNFTVRMTLKTVSVDSGISAFGSNSVAVMIGERKTARFAGVVCPDGCDTLVAEKSFTKSADMQDVTIWFPRNHPLENLEVSFPDDAVVEAPTPYAYGPVLYYGSSITEGGCAGCVFNAYNAIISRHLDLDYYNFGFSGSAKGELPIADYINSIPIEALIYDYDHNAPDAAHLEATHKAFFDRIRAAHPELPILMMTMPRATYTEGNKERRAVIRKTYEEAKAAGDQNVWFIDGETFAGDADRELCFVDTIHPNDLGFYRMAQHIEPVIKEMLKIEG